MPSRQGWRAVRRLVRWHSARAAVPVGSLVAIATASAMVGTLLLQGGINVRAPSKTNRVAAQPTAGALPVDPLVAALTDVLPVPGDGVVSSGTPEGALVAGLIATASARLIATVSARPLSGTSWSRSSTGESLGLPAVDDLMALLPLAIGLAADLALIADTGGLPGGLAERPSHVTGGSPASSSPARHRAGRDRSRAKASKRRRVRTGATWRIAPIVTWYGPGFYGNRTACGQRYTRYIVGVAHRTLPCGTLVRFRWHGMTRVAPVIDRGPYASSAYVFDFSAWLACRLFKPSGVENSCFTRYDVKYQVIGKVNLNRYFQRLHRR